MTHVSVIGCGNMGGALVKGLHRDGTHRVTAYDVDPDALDAIAAHCDEATDDMAAVEAADVVFLAVKPDIVPVVLEELSLTADQTLVTIAAGVSTAVVVPRTDAQVVRVMPNLAAETGNMAAAATGAVDDELRAILGAVGEFAEVDESLLDVATAVNGSGPAFVFYFIQAMADAGVELGLDRSAARTLTAQTFKGAAETVLRDERSLDELIDAVCSPNGTTIEGMEVFWDSDVHDVIGDAVGAAERRSRELAAEVDIAPATDGGDDGDGDDVADEGADGH
jgi:pyrroline-5-carboxylate reductase